MLVDLSVAEIETIMDALSGFVSEFCVNDAEAAEYEDLYMRLKELRDKAWFASVAS